jgi:transposase InsO family protein
VALRFSGHFDLALDALKEASCQRLGNRSREARLAHRGDRGERYLSIRYTDDLRDSGIDPSVDSRGDSCDNTFAKSVIGLFKPEVIPQRGRWRGFEDVDLDTLQRVWWFNHQRLLGRLTLGRV